MSTAGLDRWETYKQQVLTALAEAKFAPVYGELQNAKPSGDGWMQARCPLHEDKNPSLGYSTATGQWSCFSGCGKGDAFEFLVRTTGRPFKDVLVSLGERFGLPPPSSNGDGTGPIVYPYRDETGALLFEVLRGPGKKFYQRKPNGNGGWVNNVKDVRLVLYRLPELLTRPTETVYAVEGEKDADALHAAGLLATTNSGGAGKWRESHSESLRGRGVVIVPDNDAPGQEHAAQVARALDGIATTIKIVELPAVPEKGDISDWLNAGHTIEELDALVAAAPAWSPDTPTPSRPTILVTDRQHRDIISDAWAALMSARAELPLFNFVGAVTRIANAESGPAAVALSEDELFGLLLRHADWVAQTKSGIKDTKPSRDVAKVMLAIPHPDLPVLEGVVSTPVFTATGRLVTTPGYDAESRLWYEPTQGFTLPEVPACPTEDDTVAAVRLLTEELFVDFPFAAESDEAHALAALLLPFVRRLITGCAPIHDIEGTTPGSGKGLLADTVSIVARGRSCEATTLTRDENETRKKLTAVLARGAPIVLLDNIRHELDSAQLAAALTADVWSDRILGQTRMVEFPNRATWLVTANNPKLSLEIARRSIRIRLEPGDERPWERAGFKHDPLREWVLQERPRLVWAVLVLVQNWLERGRPPGARRLGSFESWAATMGGILQCAGLRGFLEDMAAFYEAADPEGEEWRAFIEAWAEKHSGHWVAVSDLLTLAQSYEALGFLVGDKSEQSQRLRLAKALRNQRDRQYGPWKVAVERDPHSKNLRYRLAAEGAMPDEGDGAGQLNLRWSEGS